jgi:polyhydroxyalkanoate synthesis regulator phasin
VEHEKEIRQALQAIARAADRAVESFDRMVAEGGMSTAIEAADAVSQISVYYEHLHRTMQAQAEASIRRILDQLGVQDQPELETDGNVVTFPGRLN